MSTKQKILFQAGLITLVLGVWYTVTGSGIPIAQAQTAATGFGSTGIA